MDKDKVTVLFDYDEFWSYYYNDFEQVKKETFGQEWGVFQITSNYIYMMNDDGDVKTVSREDVDFHWDNAEDYANEHMEMRCEDIVLCLNTINADKPFIYRGDWKRWNGIHRVGGVVPGKLSRILGYLESDSVIVGVNKETLELTVLIHDHDGYADLVVSRAIEDIDEETDFEEVKTEPIGAEALKFFGIV